MDVEEILDLGIRVVAAALLGAFLAFSIKLAWFAFVENVREIHAGEVVAPE